MNRSLKFAAVLSIAAMAWSQPVHAQGLEFSLFERYLDALRQQAGIPGLSAAVVQNGQLVWERGFGSRDLERSLPATPDTPYPVGNLTETIASVLMMQCVQAGTASLDDPIGRWGAAPDAGVTIRSLLSHTSNPGVGFKYDPSRFAWLTPAIDRCDGTANARIRLTREILDRLAMVDAVPGLDIADPLSPGRAVFADEAILKYGAVLQRLATPYTVDRRGVATPSAYLPAQIDASSGLIASVRDLAKFAAALDTAVLLRPETQAAMWSPMLTTPGTAGMGLGWFVQESTGERLIWHFGVLPNASSSLILRMPRKGLTLILLANSDGLSAPFTLSQGDVTSSLFARLFVRLFQ